jgi:hypothetical protein
MEAPGSGHKGSVDLERVTGSSQWKPLLINVEVKFFKVYVITLPMQDFLSISLSESCSKGFGISTSVGLFGLGDCLPFNSVYLSAFHVFVICCC